MRVGAEGVGRGSLECRIEIRLHLRVFHLFVFELLLHAGELFGLWLECGDFILCGGKLIAQGGLAGLGELLFAGEGLIGLGLGA